jgi:hypothetical protein
MTVSQYAMHVGGSVETITVKGKTVTAIPSPHPGAVVRVLAEVKMAGERLAAAVGA